MPKSHTGELEEKQKQTLFQTSRQNFSHVNQKRIKIIRLGRNEE